MAVNLRYATRVHWDERRGQRGAMLTPEGRRRVRHRWVDAASAVNGPPPASRFVVEWGRDRGLWYARVVKFHDGSTVVDGWPPYTHPTRVPR